MFFTVIVIVAIVAAVLLGLVVLVQNPKGGGLSGSFGGAANQIFGYKRTTDDIEKITWVLVAVVFVLCLSASALKPTEEVQQNSLETGGAKQPMNTTVPVTNQNDNQGAPIEGEQPAETGTTPETK